jgi:hypothetical protein
MSAHHRDQPEVAMRREVGNGAAEDSPGLEDAPPFLERVDRLTAIEVLERVAAVDEIDGRVREHRQPVDGRPVVDVWEVVDIDVHESREVALPASQVELQGHDRVHEA